MCCRAIEGDLQIKCNSQFSADNHHDTQSLFTSQTIYPHIKDKSGFLILRELWAEPSPGTFWNSKASTRVCAWFSQELEAEGEENSSKPWHLPWALCALSLCEPVVSARENVDNGWQNSTIFSVKCKLCSACHEGCRGWDKRRSSHGGLSQLACLFIRGERRGHWFWFCYQLMEDSVTLSVHLCPVRAMTMLFFYMVLWRIKQDAWPFCSLPCMRAPKLLILFIIIHHSMPCRFPLHLYVVLPSYQESPLRQTSPDWFSSERHSLLLILSLFLLPFSA